MSSKILLWTGLIGIGATIALVQPNVAVAKSSVEIAETAKAITVFISEPNSVGSGVILQHQGDVYTVLTAAHVVKNKASYKITTPDDRSYEVISSSIRRAPGSIDLAVVKFKSTAKYPTAKLGNCNVLKSGMDLYVGGFPGTSRAITESVFVFREGKVSANSNKTFENGYSLIYSNDTLPGMSGGAVLNSDGELVAIHGRGDKQRLRNGEFGEKNGFNLGIPVNRFAAVASNMGVGLSGKVLPIPTNTELNADDYFVAVGQKYKKGDIKGALTDMNQVIAINPKYTNAYLLRGVLKNDLNDVQGALADYNQAIVLNPQDANAYISRGKLKYKKLGDIQGALADFNQAATINPKNADVYIGRGMIKHEALNNLQGALVDFNQAIALNPREAIAYNVRGVLKNDLNDVKGALADYDQAIALDPQSENGYPERADLKYQRLNDDIGAIADRNQAIVISPQSADAYYNRGDLFYSLGNIPAALFDFQKVVAIDKNSINGLIAQGVIETQRGEYSKAITTFEKAFTIAYETSSLRSSLGLFKYSGVAYKKQGKREVAIIRFQTLASMYKKNNSTRDYRMMLSWLKEMGAGV
jgi:tetratricopeptide (TPR) repeat protein